jgi:hypothetical protein
MIFTCGYGHRLAQQGFALPPTPAAALSQGDKMDKKELNQKIKSRIVKSGKKLLHPKSTFSTLPKVAIKAAIKELYAALRGK